MGGESRVGVCGCFWLVACLVGLSLVSGTVTSHAGTTGFGLGLDQLPLPGSGDWQPPQRPADPWRPPDEPIRLLPPGIGQAPSFGIRLRDDAVSLLKLPLEWEGADWRRLGLGVLAVGAVSMLDERVNAWSDRTRSDTTTSAIEAIRPLGDKGGLALLGAAWLAGRATGRPKLIAIAEDGLEATVIASGVVTPLLKLATGRARPRDTDRAFALGGSGSSFPSGEAAEAFAIASVIAGYSESPWVKGLAWGGAGLVGLGRIGLDGHWASDVVAGALIGAAAGHWVVRRHRPDLEGGPRMTVLPTFGRERYGLAMSISF